MIRLGICNELFEGWDFERVCRTVRDIGYDGLEIAPFTLAPRITDLSRDERLRLRDIMRDCGLACIGLHWLLAKTEGFYLTSPDATTRMKTGAYLIELARATRDLGGNVMVLGSPKQRDLLPGVSHGQANDWAREVFATIMPEIGSLDVDLCLEPLAPNDTNFLNTIPQAMDLIAQVDHPNFRLHLDVKAQSADPTGSVTELIAKYARDAGHFHAQDTNLQGPGMGDVDFGPILRSLVATGYDRWVSVEVFDYAPGAERTAQESHDCLRRELDAAYRTAAGHVG
jgi:sugar phosphate isomerase/epimerase